MLFRLYSRMYVFGSFILFSFNNMSRSFNNRKTRRDDYWSRRGEGINPSIPGKFTKRRTSKKERASQKKETRDIGFAVND